MFLSVSPIKRKLEEVEKLYDHSQSYQADRATMTTQYTAQCISEQNFRKTNLHPNISD